MSFLVLSGNKRNSLDQSFCEKVSYFQKRLGQRLDSDTNQNQNDTNRWSLLTFKMPKANNV